MSRTRRFHAIALLSLFFLGSFEGSAQAGVGNARVASVLFSQFETVGYSASDFLSIPLTAASAGYDSENDLRFPFLMLIGSLRFLGPSTEHDVETAYRSFYAGARDFLGPEGIGMVSSHDCFIGILKGTAKPNLENDFSGAEREVMDGRQVWTWSLPPYDGYPRPTKFYAAQIGDSYFVLANNAKEFEETVRALKAAEGTASPSIGVAGWETFSKYKYWVYRQVRRGGSVDPQITGIKFLTPDISALAFYSDIDSGIGTLSVFSSDATMKVKPNVLPEAALDRLQPKGAGVWQATLPLSKDVLGLDVMYRLYYFFGFGLSL
jgi:hypothetical protein